VYEGTLLDLLKEVVKSWQVIAVTVAIIFYFFIVTRVGRVYKYKRSKPRKKISIKKKEKAKDAPVPIVDDSADSSNDELGLS